MDRVQGGQRAHRLPGGFAERVLDASLCGIFVHDAEVGTHLYVNPEFTRLTGWSLDELSQMPAERFAELVHPDDRASLRAHQQRVMASAGAASFDIEYRFRHAYGHFIRCYSRDAAFDRDAEGRATRFVGSFLDVTDHRRHAGELALVQSRLEVRHREALRALAGGVAHEFNHLMTSILGNAALIQQALSDRGQADAADGGSGAPAPDVVELLQNVMWSAERAATLTGKLQESAGAPSSRSPDTVDLTALVEQLMPMLRDLVDPSATFEFDRLQQPMMVRAAAAEIRNMIHGLVANAAEAIEGREAGPGTVTLQLQAVAPGRSGHAFRKLDATYLAASPVHSTKGFARIVVEDDGDGIPPSLLERVFEPFYSTRLVGRGLGLSAILGVVKARGGGLRLASTAGEGTRVEVMLPFTPLPSDAPSRS